MERSVPGVGVPFRHAPTPSWPDISWRVPCRHWRRRVEEGVNSSWDVLNGCRGTVGGFLQTFFLLERREVGLEIWM